MPTIILVNAGKSDAEFTVTGVSAAMAAAGTVVVIVATGVGSVVTGVYDFTAAPVM